MDVPDSSDYWEDIQEHLITAGIPSENIVPISAVTGENVIDLVRRLRAVLDALPETVSPYYCTPVLGNTAVLVRGLHTQRSRRSHSAEACPVSITSQLESSFAEAGISSHQLQNPQWVTKVTICDKNCIVGGGCTHNKCLEFDSTLQGPRQEAH